MPKKCIVCREHATHRIKDTSEYYCEECARENFADLDMLITIEQEDAQRLKAFLEEKKQETKNHLNSLEGSSLKD